MRIISLVCTYNDLHSFSAISSSLTTASFDTGLPPMYWLDTCPSGVSLTVYIDLINWACDTLLVHTLRVDQGN